MNSRPVETLISSAWIMAEIECLLRRYRLISDSEVMEDFEFGEIVKDCVKVRFRAVREEV